ncbi:SHOCT domain-containing protein [Natronolimnobius sp. AArcel1]|uniref:SHOCT domain-containing protein n=1 Tax=Natronolimnobius sp. AArcel1 TaxID=1679093 RepID=UPI0013EB64DA|nr:SHOCT domain-containing protein [Natronolimnobius sp. AArcel1]NGM67651.1 SHOCT domain-containing protein [Natronolimnobius sp. AArcel1]
MEERVWDTLIATVAVLTLPLGLLAGIFVSFQTALVVFIVGWLLLLPLLAISREFVVESSDDPNRGSHESADTSLGALETLKKRYAEGEIDEHEFERKVDTLVGTEDIEMDRTNGTDQSTRESDEEYDLN